MQQSLSQWMKELSKRVDVDTQTVSRGQIAHMEPLSKQIDRWLAETPPAVIERPWTMAELQKIFVGRYRQRAYPQHIASELRKRGWHSRRTWTYPGYGQRLWFAPKDFV